ncbi:MAG: PLP-dependent aminotransferase family protein [Pseudomonadota bacterium]
MNTTFLGSFLDDGPNARPLQWQLIQRLKHAILQGQFPAGGKLPSSRALAEELNISRNTVLIAYEQLTAEGYIIADRQGTRVAQLKSHQGSKHHTDAATALIIKANKNALYAERLKPIAASQRASDRTLPMTLGLPALNHFPIHLWRKAYDRALHEAPAASLGYGNPLGELALRQAIAHHLRISRGVRCEASHIVITEGAQEALSLCVKLFTNPKDTAWVEEPGYRGAKNAFYAGDLNVIAMRVDNDGIVIPPQAWLTHSPRLIQTTPSHQYPTGAVLSITRRLDLIEQARRVGAWIVEDDYDSEFRHQGEPIASMQGLMQDSPVLYVGTFSKTMFPALRLGFLVLPECLTSPALISVISEILRGGHRLEQLAMAHFIESGQFSRHLGRMRRLYRERQYALREALAAHLIVEHQVLGGNSGLHLTVRLPKTVSDQMLVAEALKIGIGPTALSAFAIEPTEEDNGLVIGYGNTSAERFHFLIKQLNNIVCALS